MEVFGTVAGAVALVETCIKYKDYYSHVKNAKKEIEGLWKELEALTSVLQELDKLARSPEATRLFASRSLNKDIQQCSTHLEHLQKKLESGKGRKAKSRYRIRALK